MNSTPEEIIGELKKIQEKLVEREERLLTMLTTQQQEIEIIQEELNNIRQEIKLLLTNT